MQTESLSPLRRQRPVFHPSQPLAIVEARFAEHAAVHLLFVTKLLRR